jgi:(p)ppGpp synthase/HD superfamily hydrolase
LAVAGLALEFGGGEGEAIAALLHDSIEDCRDRHEGPRAALREEFGDTVLVIVKDCTEDDRYPKDTPDADTAAAWHAQELLSRADRAGRPRIPARLLCG